MTQLEQTNTTPGKLTDFLLVSVPTRGQTELSYPNQIHENPITTFSFQLHATTERDDRILVGEISVTTVSETRRRMDGELSLIHVLSLSTATYEASNMLINDKTGELKQSLVKKAGKNGEVYGLLFLNSIGVDPEYQRLGYGLDMIHMVEALFSETCSVFVLSPSPRQYEDILSDREDLTVTNGEEFSAIKKTPAKRKLQNYFSKAGFELFDSKYHMIKPILAKGA